MVQNDKKFCPSHSVSQEPYIIWSPFVVHNCKIMIFPGLFFIFPKFWFFKLLGGQGVIGQKMIWNDKKLCCSWYLRNNRSYDCHLWYTSVQDGPKWQKTISVALHISRSIHHMIVIFAAQWHLLMLFPFFSKFWLSVLFGG